MPISSFFGGVQRFAGQVLNKAQDTYRQLDRASGGWLPGGGVASPITARVQEQQRQSKAEKARIQSLPPYVGKPGERSNRAGYANALDVLSRAGASPIGFATANPNDLTLVKNYFTKNPDVMNQYDLPTNMFLRYYTGVGAQGMQFSPEQSDKIRQGIEIAKQRTENPVKREEFLSQFNPAYRKSYEDKIGTGLIPVATPESLPPGGEVNFSLGRHWAKPTSQDGYQVDEKFDWGMAPINKGGSKDPGQRRMAQVLSQRPAWLSALSGPAGLAQNLVARGYGEPFSYRLNIPASGQIQVEPLPNK